MKIQRALEYSRALFLNRKNIFKISDYRELYDEYLEAAY